MKNKLVITTALILLFSAGLVHAHENRHASSGTRQKKADNAPRAEPHMQKVLDTLSALGVKPIEKLRPEEARKQPTPSDAVKKLLQDMGKSTDPVPGVTVKNSKVLGPLGDTPIHIYTPEGKGPFPVMVYYHGGGFVMADTETYDASPRALAEMAEAIMVSVDYRQAPEHKFPTAANDAYAAYDWVLQHASEFNGDPARASPSAAKVQAAIWQPLYR